MLALHPMRRVFCLKSLLLVFGYAWWALPVSMILLLVLIANAIESTLDPYVKGKVALWHVTYYLTRSEGLVSRPSFTHWHFTEPKIIHFRAFRLPFRSAGPRLGPRSVPCPRSVRDDRDRKEIE